MPEKTWEEETLELLEWAKEEKHKAETRLASAQRAVGNWTEKEAMVEHALELYRARYGVVSSSVPTDSILLAEFSGLGPKEMIVRWAEKHVNKVVMKELVKASVRAGSFADERQAAGTLYSTVKRMRNFFKVKRGVYERLLTSASDVEAETNGHDGTRANLITVS